MTQKQNFRINQMKDGMSLRQLLLLNCLICMFESLFMVFKSFMVKIKAQNGQKSLNEAVISLICGTDESQ